MDNHCLTENNRENGNTDISKSNTSKKSKFSSKFSKAIETDKKWKDINPEYYIWSIELNEAGRLQEERSSLCNRPVVEGSMLPYTTENARKNKTKT
jgi:hypothetical protein